MTNRKLSPLHWIVGVALGIAGALVLMPLLGGDGDPPEQSTIGAAISDCDGEIRELVIQYTPASTHIIHGPYRSFLTQLPAAVTVHVICPDRAAFDALCAHVGSTACKLNPIFVDHKLTCWSRDRWVALHPAGESTAVTLLSPQGELAADVWPERKGDEQIGEGLQDALAPNVIAVRSELYFDGGDLVGDNETYFVTPNVRRRNLQRTVKTEEELEKRLAEVLGRKIVLLKDAPDHHACMFMMPVGNKTVIVGDPRMARELLSEAEIAALPIPEGADFGDATLAKFDAVATQCSEAGYKVVRIPLAPGKDGRVFLTPINAILDERDGKRMVYMPRFDGADKINDASTEVWKGLGYEVRPVDCTDCYRYFGSLRCLVNVLRRD
jgi:hypothetical protein